jgi:hypothetical protein
VSTVSGGGIWSSPETFQSVRSWGAPGELHQAVVGGLVFLVFSCEEGVRIGQMLEYGY